MKQFFTTALGRFRLVAIIEGISVVLLFLVGMPLKYAFGIPEATRYSGRFHGLMVVVYVFALLSVWVTQRWSIRKAALAFLASFIPFATFYFEHKIRDEVPRETLN